MTNQPDITSALTTSQSGSAVGYYTQLPIKNTDDKWWVPVDWGLIIYNSDNYTGAILVNYKNTGTIPIIVRPSAVGGNSVKIYFKDVQI